MTHSVSMKIPGMPILTHVLIVTLLLQRCRSLITPPVPLSAVNNSQPLVAGEPLESTESTTKSAQPMLIPLRRESVPIKRKGKVVSFRTSYSGTISVGSPLHQNFRVVFDTGSAYLVLPSLECGSEACKLHKQYNALMSSSAVPINSDGRVLQPGKKGEHITISYGTGEVKGEFVEENVCIAHATDGDASVPDSDRTWDYAPCLTMRTVMATEMSTVPFKNFGFDGILGMGLPILAVFPEYSFLHMLTRSGTATESTFGVFLTDDEDSEQSELALGGHDPKRLLGPLMWTPVIRADLGYWLVQVLAVRVGGETLDVCKDGTCVGVMDTGTSHFGIPTPHDSEVVNMLTMPAGDMLDCRLADLPPVEIDLPGVSITIHPDTYMRRLPLREDVNVDTGKDRHTGHFTNSSETSNTTNSSGSSNTSNSSESSNSSNTSSVKRYCRPRMMPVNIPPPLGPKVFILGEPVLHRYYSVFDWETPKVGLALADTRKNHVDTRTLSDRIGSLPKDTDVYLMQMSANTCGSSDTCPNIDDVGRP